MDLWQFEIYFLPKEEMDSFFPGANAITHEDFENIDWWKYRKLNKESLEIFESVLPLNEWPWTDTMILFGDVESDCVELFLENEIVAEVSVRLDIRNLNHDLIKMVCSYCQQHKYILVDRDMKIIPPLEETLRFCIDEYTRNSDEIFK